MKSLDTIIRDKLVAKYLQKDTKHTQSKTSNINILLNRIEVNKKMKQEKSYIFQLQPLQG